MRLSCVTYRRYGLHETGLDLLERVFHRNKLRLVLSTDVVEHVPSPGEHLARAGEQVAPGGFLYLQTPADPRRPPYRPGAGGNGPPAAPAALPPAPGHDGLAPGRAQPARLRTRGQDHRPCFHTRIPFLNLPTIDWYLDRHGGLVALNEPFRWSSPLRPGFWYRGLAGGLVSRTDEVQLIFRRAG